MYLINGFIKYYRVAQNWCYMILGPKLGVHITNVTGRRGCYMYIYILSPSVQEKVVCKSTSLDFFFFFFCFENPPSNYLSSQTACRSAINHASPSFPQYCSCRLSYLIEEVCSARIFVSLKSLFWTNAIQCIWRVWYYIVTLKLHERSRRTYA